MSAPTLFFLDKTSKWEFFFFVCGMLITMEICIFHHSEIPSFHVLASDLLYGERGRIE